MPASCRSDPFSMVSRRRPRVRFNSARSTRAADCAIGRTAGRIIRQNARVMYSLCLHRMPPLRAVHNPALSGCCFTGYESGPRPSRRRRLDAPWLRAPRLVHLAALGGGHLRGRGVALLWVDRRGTWDAAYVASRNLADGWPAPWPHHPGAGPRRPGRRLRLHRTASYQLRRSRFLPGPSRCRRRGHVPQPPLPQPPARRRRDRRSAGGSPIPMAASPAWSWARCAWRIFRDRFAGLSIGERDVITVFRNDGAVLARDPYSMSDLGDDLAMSPAFQQF